MASFITVTSHVPKVSVIPLPVLSPHAKEITVDLDEIVWVVIRDCTFIRRLKKMGIQLDITAGLMLYVQCMKFQCEIQHFL
jgi:hypothetical protein